MLFGGQPCRKINELAYLVTSHYPQDVTLLIAGARHFRSLLAAGSFTRTGLGGYIACQKNGSFKTEILLQPFKGGEWAYSAGIEGFKPGSTTMTVSLTIGHQAGRATAQILTF